MCSPAEFVTMSREGTPLTFRISGHLVNVFADEEVCTYPTPCKGRYRDTETGTAYYPFQSPNSLNALKLLPRMRDAGVDAIKIEGRQRSHVYVRNVARIYRSAIDSLEDAGALPPRRLARWERELASLFEGRELTTACYGEK